MTTYTSPHSLPIKEATDKIAASTEGLRQDLNAVAQAANTAITAEGARAEGAAKGYADTRDASNRSAWAAADAATLASAKTYSDEQNQAYRVVDWAQFRSEDATNLAAAKNYADTKDATTLAAAKTYSDDQNQAYRVVDWAKFREEDATNLATAKTYADGLDAANRAAWAAADAVVLTAAKAYTDTEVAADRSRLTSVEAKNVVQDTSISQARVEATSYTDTREDAIRKDFATSNIALDTDGTPFISFGSMTVRVLQDSDGTPYYEAA